ncbi:MAG TPA: hypothetical protein PKZ76_04990, partial [Xanthomonadaceae bacterium]|nr:hypothetical protein [Xanthomonadaceae bacterium]
MNSAGPRASGGAADAHALDRLLEELLDLDEEARAIRLQAVEGTTRRRLQKLLAAALDDDGFLTPGGALHGELIEAALREESALVAGC